MHESLKESETTETEVGPETVVDPEIEANSETGRIAEAGTTAISEEPPANSEGAEDDDVVHPDDVANPVPPTAGAASGPLIGNPLRTSDDPLDRVDWPRLLPYWGIHAACLLVFWVGFSWVGLALAVSLYLVRMFAITAFYHRYFSHRSFKAGRIFQFLAGALGCSSAQRGPMWWAAHHRHHHKHSDDPEDVHSPRQHGFVYSHAGWFMTHRNFVTKSELIQDWMKFPELRLLEQYNWVPFALMLGGSFGLGALLESAGWEGVTGSQLLVWALISTVFLYHGTYTINSLSHVFGKKRFKTGDDSRNNWFLAIITLGEGWHNNHHYYSASTRQGFYWWEIDVSYYVLKFFSFFGLVWDLRPVPKRVLDLGRDDGESGSSGSS